nr:NifB/NifX family molybdenum-iron cluster-binding protein [uncultured Cohaesibacter sp.]
MKIAVSSQNFRTVTGHAGRCRRFLVYSVGENQEPVEIERIDLPKDMSMHDIGDTGAAHPLDNVDVLLSASFGASFAVRMEARSVMTSVTEQTDPLEAVKEFLAKGQNLADLCGGNPDRDHSGDHNCHHSH